MFEVNYIKNEQLVQLEQLEPIHLGRRSVPKNGLYTSKEISEIVGVSKNTLFKWLDQELINQPEKRTIYQFLWSQNNIENITEYIERRRR